MSKVLARRANRTCGGKRVAPIRPVQKSVAFDMYRLLGETRPTEDGTGRVGGISRASGATAGRRLLDALGFEAP